MQYIVTARPIIHGHRKANSKPTPTYYTWRKMIERCHDANHKSYPHYGAQGIKVCAKWRESFINFLLDVGERPTGMTLHRKDETKGYEKSNCVWRLKKDHQLNGLKNHINKETLLAVA